MTEQTKFTKEYIKRAYSSAEFLVEPGCILFREALVEIEKLNIEIERLENEYKILESKFDFFYNRLDPEGQQFPPDSKERWG